MLPSHDRLTREVWNTLSADPPIKKGYNAIGTLYTYKVNTVSGCSVVCSKKHQKKAVNRNKLKRQLYTIFRTSPYRKVYSYIIYPSKNAYTFDFETIKLLFNELLSKNS